MVKIMQNIRVLFAGEAIFALEKRIVGRDSFDRGVYWEHGKFFEKALKDNGIEYRYIPTNKVGEEFPWTIEELRQYNAVIVSDVGSDTFLITKRTMSGERTPNRLKLIEQYVREGGGFLMWGGYLSFTGLAGKGFYKGTAIEKLLPVNLLPTDDRIEAPEGFLPKITSCDHPILEGIPRQWEGFFLSYNRLVPKENATVIGNIEEYDNDPFLVVGEYGLGRTMASAVDCAHHGAAPNFLNWEYTSKLYGNMVKWICRAI
jgi:uncharacterized membrane protein